LAAFERKKVFVLENFGIELARTAFDGGVCCFAINFCTALNPALRKVLRGSVLSSQRMFFERRIVFGGGSVLTAHTAWEVGKIELWPIGGEEYWMDGMVCMHD
jgi:hypothetical protein